MSAVAPYLDPLFDRVVVVRLAPESLTDSGLEIPEVAQHVTGRATIIAIGPECTEILAAGDEVVISEYAGVSVTFNKIDYLVLREKEIVLRVAK